MMFLAAPDVLACSCNNMGGCFPFPFIFLVIERVRRGEVEWGLVNEQVRRPTRERERDREEGSPLSRNTMIDGDSGPDTELTIGDRLIIVSMVCEWRSGEPGAHSSPRNSERGGGGRG